MSNESEEGFLSRWSRRKQQQANIKDNSQITETPLTPVEQLQYNEVVSDDEPEERDIRSGAKQAASVSDDEPEERVEPQPIWQQTEATQQEKTAALRALFRQPEFNQIDRLNDYDQDFAKYSSIEGLVTAQMKRMIKLAEQRTRPDEVEDTVKPTLTTVSDSIVSDAVDGQPEISDNNDDREDKPLA